MGRPKGSKNKSTLEREARERKEKEKEKEKETAERKNIDKQSIKLSPGADVESESGVYMGEGENGSERTLEGITEVGAGEEPKDKPSSKSKPRKSSLPQCERCGAEIPGDPLKLDTNLLTGKADYHRESRRYVRLCNKCSCELSELVDRWLWDKEEGGNPELRKFPLGDGDK